MVKVGYKLAPLFTVVKLLAIFDAIVDMNCVGDHVIIEAGSNKYGSCSCFQRSY